MNKGDDKNEAEQQDLGKEEENVKNIDKNYSWRREVSEPFFHPQLQAILCFFLDFSFHLTRMSRNLNPEKRRRGFYFIQRETHTVRTLTSFSFNEWIVHPFIQEASQEVVEGKEKRKTAQTDEVWIEGQKSSSESFDDEKPNTLVKQAKNKRRNKATSAPTVVSTGVHFSTIIPGKKRHRPSTLISRVDSKILFRVRLPRVLSTAFLLFSVLLQEKARRINERESIKR